MSDQEITVVVPYYNESHVLEFTLEQIAKQTLPATKAVFVNSSSTDSSSDVVDAWISNNQAKFKTEFVNVFENSSNPGSSKNVGVRHADTKWVAFMDCGQEFELDWLENQYKYVADNSLDISFGVVCLTGENWVDRCAVAQTYGYKVPRTCTPGSIVKRKVFDKTGCFIEGRRAGYDLAWRIKVRSVNIKYDINYNAQIAYQGINFASSTWGVFKKSILYSRPSFGLDGYYTPYYHLFGFLLIMLVIISLPLISIYLFVSYFIVRSFLIPIMKSKSVLFYKEHPFEAILGLGLVGLLIDVGKVIGYFMGWVDLIKNKYIKLNVFKSL